MTQDHQKNNEKKNPVDETIYMKTPIVDPAPPKENNLKKENTR